MSCLAWAWPEWRSPGGGATRNFYLQTPSPRRPSQHALQPSAGYRYASRAPYASEFSELRKSVITKTTTKEAAVKVCLFFWCVQAQNNQNIHYSPQRFHIPRVHQWDASHPDSAELRWSFKTGRVLHLVCVSGSLRNISDLRWILQDCIRT